MNHKIKDYKLYVVICYVCALVSLLLFGVFGDVAGLVFGIVGYRGLSKVVPATDAEKVLVKRLTMMARNGIILCAVLGVANIALTIAYIPMLMSAMQSSVSMF